MYGEPAIRPTRSAIIPCEVRLNSEIPGDIGRKGQQCKRFERKDPDMKGWGYRWRKAHWITVVSLAFVFGVSACSPSPDEAWKWEAFCKYPCRTNPHNLPLEPDYAQQRERDEPGYIARNAALKREEDESGFTAEIDRLSAELDYNIARTHAIEADMRANYNEPVFSVPWVTTGHWHHRHR